MAPKILVVDDERPIAEILKFNLAKEGYDVSLAYDGQEALELARSISPDLILLDIMLPVMDGFEVCREIRKTSRVPILVLTAKDSEIDKVLGLELGADDYVTKPFSPRELVARIRAVLRRSHRPESSTTGGRQEDVLRIGNIVVKLAEREVTVDGEPIQLTPTEFEILAYLASNPGIVLTRDQLAAHVWGYDSEGETRLLDTHIAHLRAKLEKGRSSPRYLITVRNVGYKLNPTPGSGS